MCITLTYTVLYIPNEQVARTHFLRPHDTERNQTPRSFRPDSVITPTSLLSYCKCVLYAQKYQTDKWLVFNVPNVHQLTITPPPAITAWTANTSQVWPVDPCYHLHVSTDVQLCTVAFWDAFLLTRVTNSGNPELLKPVCLFSSYHDLFFKKSPPLCRLETGTEIRRSWKPPTSIIMLYICAFMLYYLIFQYHTVTSYKY